MSSSNIIFAILEKSQNYDYKIDSEHWELLDFNCTGFKGNSELFSYSSILS